ncbi:MAG: L-serine ammonia-lyase, iron-sulfur-dependent, subunit alpha, partial [Synergistaceae bacterium]|nr:L-serine ammonia-lyase, iron-sulfur-dependent, subunit alpha [Synergistaceae bacterium]
PEKIRTVIKSRLKDMETSVEEALSENWDGKISVDHTSSMSEYLEKGNPLSGKFIFNAARISMSVASYNSCMGRIVAAPTAGSCGIIPGILFSWEKYFQEDREKMIDALITAAGTGEIIAERATLAGAEGGCQAECGAAAAMAAASLVFLRKGTPSQVAEAAALAIKSIMGLVCDPVAGLVEVPCIKRNGALVSLAGIAADMALAGVKSIIPPDEVIDAMSSVGKSLPVTLKETALGGVAMTPTGKKLSGKVEKE